MTGAELTVAGWIASPAIRMVIDTARSYLRSNYDQHTKAEEMLLNLEINLPQIELAVMKAEQRPSQRENMGNLLKKLKLAVSNAEDVLDDFKELAIREKQKGKGKIREFASSSVKILKNVIVPDENLDRLKKAVDMIQSVCSGVLNALKIMDGRNDNNAIEESTGTNIKETTSLLPKNMKIFGREKEIESILKMIVDFNPYAGKDDDKTKPEGKKGEMPREPIQTNLSNQPLGYGEFPDLDIIPRFGGMVLHKDTRIKRMHKDLSDQPLQYGESGSSQEKTEFSNVQTSKENLSAQLSPKIVQEVLWKIEVNNWSLGVLPIVGITGVGKTTLAQVIYNNQIVQANFLLRSWVYVSNISNHKKLIENIIFSFDGVVDRDRSLDFVEKVLVGIIKNEKFFLVLDDVWDDFSDLWNNKLLPVLGEGAPGSVVLVTTQSQIVASMMRTLPPIKLDALPLKYFWPLFKHHAFRHINRMSTLNEHEISELELIGEEIAKKLHGIPLEAEIIGNLLKTKNIEQLRKILESNWWNATGASKYILPSLGFGYQSLDPKLKQSFLYGSIFPKGYVFEKNRLVEMWISHGFVQPNEMEKTQIERGETRLEDIGNQMFEMLVDRFFLQPTVWENKFVMHDLVRDLALVISSNEFCIINNGSQSIPSFCCHLTLNNEGLKTNLGDRNYKTLRTLIFSGEFDESMSTALPTIFKEPSSLRLLDLSEKIMGTNGFPDVCKQLSHLRFLDLSFTGISLLPDAISNLCHLQVLDVRNCNFARLPKKINNLINLRHLYASAATISLISNIGKLVNLQELEKFPVTKEEHKISELRDLNEIRGTLRILNLDVVRTEEEVRDSNLIEKKHLSCLKLKWRSGYWVERSLKGIADILKPPSDLRELKMKNYPWNHFPNWMVENENLRKLKRLELCGGFLKDLPPFGQLPLLEVLTLKNLEYIEKINVEFYGSYEVTFPYLKDLSLINMSSLKEWSDIEGGKTFPRLRKLHLHRCWKLEKVPIHSFGKSVIELYISKVLTSAQIAIFRQLTALTRLTIIEYPRETLCCYDQWKSVEVLVLREVKINNENKGIKNLVNLKRLELYEVQFEPFIERLKEKQPQEEPALQLLTYLEFKCMRIDSLLFLGRLPLLRTLSIHNSEEDFHEEQEIWFEQQTSLEEIEFVKCAHLMHIPAAISTLSSLKKLSITDCPNIKSLHHHLPENLKELYITRCPEELVKRCSPEGGEYWPNISHVPCIRIDASKNLGGSMAPRSLLRAIHVDSKT